MTKRTEADPRSFAERFEHLDDEVPMTLEEAKAILSEAKVDPAASLQFLLGEMEAVETRKRQARFANAEVARRRGLARIERGYENLGRPELLQQLDMYRASYPELRANFRNFQEANEDELRSLLAEIEELIRRDAEKE